MQVSRKHLQNSGDKVGFRSEYDDEGLIKLASKIKHSSIAWCPNAFIDRCAWLCDEIPQ